MKEGIDMSESTKTIQSLKRAANYTKLAFHDLGPKSYKKGQGALIKVVYKFGENGTISKKTLEKILGWRGKELRAIAKKAEHNGYVTIEDPEFQFKVSLTDKGTEVVKKRLAAEDRTADAILEALSAEEKQQLLAITDKIIKTCEGLGIDYDQIQKKQHCKKHGHDGKKCCKKHGHAHDHCHHGHHGSPQYVFVFGEEGHHHHHHE